MQRRNVNATAGPDAGDNSSSGSVGPLPHSSPSARLGRTSSRDYSLPQRRGESCSTGMLLLIAALVTAATFMFPTELQGVEKEAYQELEKAEKEVYDWWQHHGESQSATGSYQRTSEEATRAMLQQSSKWVDGEKKLKQKLKVLASRQEQGKDLGAPVLTRYLGEDVPAWAGPEVDQAKWQNTVTAKYDEMRRQEEEWKRMIQAIVDQEKRG